MNAKGRWLAGLALALWVGLGALLMPLPSRTAEVKSIDAALVLPRDAEATRALVREREAFPGTDTPVAVVVYAREGGLTAQDRSAVEADRAAFAALAHQNINVGLATASGDGEALLLSFPIAGDITGAGNVVERIKERLAHAPPGLQTAVSGSAGRSPTPTRPSAVSRPRCCWPRPPWSRWYS